MSTLTPRHDSPGRLLIGTLCLLAGGCQSLGANVAGPSAVPVPAAVAAVAVPPPPVAGDALVPPVSFSYTGRATDPDTGRLLYTESHTLAADGRQETVQYRDAGGESLGEKTLDYAGQPYAPLYRLDLDVGYTEAVTARSPDGRSLTATRGWGGGERTGTIATKGDEPLFADAGVDRFIADHLPALARGEAFDFRVAVVPRFESYRLQVAKLGDATVDGRPAVRLEVGADSLFIRLAFAPAEITYDLASRRVLRYEGISPIRDPETGRIYRRVRVDFGPATPATSAPAAAAG